MRNVFNAYNLFPAFDVANYPFWATNYKPTLNKMLTFDTYVHFFHAKDLRRGNGPVNEGKEAK